MADHIGQQFGDYRLTHLLGSGGSGDVYRGEHIHVKSLVAVKLLRMQLTNTDELKEFINEARTFRLKHPNIVQILDFGIAADGTPFLVMDYAPNGSLRQRHPKSSCLPLETIVSYVKQVARALQYAHDQKLIHRDVKPENMLLGPDDEVLLSDFGISVTSHTSQSQEKYEGIGTVSYMAPEQILGKPHPASDQYALGVVVYEWLSGSLPFIGSPVELYGRHLHATPPSLREKIPDIPPTLEEVVLTTLAKDPQHRFARVEDFAHALEKGTISPFLDLHTAPSIKLKPVEAIEDTIHILSQKKCLQCGADRRREDAFCPNCHFHFLPVFPSDQDVAGKSIMGSLIMPTFGNVILGAPKGATASSEDQIVLDDPDATQSLTQFMLIKQQLLEKGDAHYEHKQFSDALIAYEDLIQLDPQDAVVHAKKSTVLLRLGRYEEALIVCNHALNIAPENASIWAAKGELLYKMKRYKDALDAYGQASTFAPDEVTIWETKGNVLRDLKYYEEALIAYDRVLELSPNNAPVWVTKGKILYKLERYEEALEAYIHASILISRRTSVWIDRGEVLYKLKRYEDALEAYKRALALKPHDLSISNKCDMLHDLIKHREELAASQIASWPGLKSIRVNDQQAIQPDSDQTISPNMIYQETFQKQPLKSSGNPEYYHVFLSHSHLDTEWVENLATQLEDEQSFHIWLDKWVLIPGQSFQQATARGIDQAQCCAICIGEQTPIGWFKEEIQKALNRQTKDPHFRVIPVLLPNAKDIAVDDFLQLKTWVDFRGSDRAHAFHLLVCGIKGVPPGRPPSKKVATTQTGIIAEDRLRELQQFREKKLIDESVAVEYQRIVLKTLWLGEISQEKEMPNE